MEYSWSAETDADVAERVLSTGRSAASAIGRRLEAGDLKHIDLHVGYVPIVKAPREPDWYPARTKLRKKQRLLDCAPKLNHSAFQTNSGAAVAEWIRGIRECLPLLEKLPLTAAEMAGLDLFFASVREELERSSVNE